MSEHTSKSYQDVWAQVEPRIQQSLADLSKERSEAFRKVPLQGLFVGLPIGLIIGAFTEFHIVVFILAYALGCVIMGIADYTSRNGKYKREVMPKLVDALCPGATYSPQGTISKDMIAASHLFPAGWGERFENEDTIRGVVGKTDFVYGEVELYHMQQSGKTTVKVTDFKGFVFEADFNKYFQGVTLLSSQKFRLATHLGFFSGLNRCKLEDVRFEDAYRTYTTNDQEARYILTPALQERILQMNKVFRTQLGDDEVNISFHDDRMLIMVPSSTNRFEVKYDAEGVRRDFLALSLMLDIVEQLNLNLRIWSKE